MRIQRAIVVQVCPPEDCECRRQDWVTDYTCDSCGKKISREDHDGDYAHELQVGLDMEECVSFFRERDYCPVCLDTIWKGISILIRADPDVEREEGRER